MALAIVGRCHVLQGCGTGQRLGFSRCFFFLSPVPVFEEWDDVTHGLAALNARGERNASTDV